MTHSICADCIYFMPDKGIAGELSPFDGYCRRYPPVMTHIDCDGCDISAYPSAKSSGLSCGEFTSSVYV